ncbi:peptidase family M1-domain-containing protein [Lactifluus volemus]|nr:peptidase family M1-domain-containing protein [Lactifluus volemus]
MSEKALDHYRLPTDVRPRHYDLTIRTDLEKERFFGFVKIDLDIVKATKVVTFNSAIELELVPSTLVLASSGGELTPVETKVDAAAQRISLVFDEELSAGAKATLRLGFGAALTDSMTGYYKSTWDKGIYALTQFEPTDARRALPCWDEPLLKATFAVTLISRKGTVSLSNMPARPDIAVTSFETTPPVSTERWKEQMSTYLLAIANGDFMHLESSYISPLSGKVRPLRIYATADVIHQAQKALPLYEKVFDIEYPLPKLDTLVANDFDAGAMENWGLITGRTNAYLVDPENADIAAKKRIAGTQCHEVWEYHNMKWWDNLYLNEVEIPDPGQIGQIFDLLSYAKAASVLRMLSKYVGEDKFLMGVSLYLKKHLYSNTVSATCGREDSGGLDIPTMMDSWVSKMGFPVLTVTETPTGIKVRQDRFLEDGPARPEDNETIWSIPLGIVTSSAPGQGLVDNTALLVTREAEFKLDTNKPFKINADTNGVCESLCHRVLYTPTRLAGIANEAAKPESIFSLSDRIGLVHDAAALNLVHELRAEKECACLNHVSGSGELTRGGKSWSGTAWAQTWQDRSHMVGGDKVTQYLNAFRRTLFSPLVERLGFEYSENDSADTTQLRTLVIAGAATAGDAESVTNRLEYIAGDTSAIPVDLLVVTFCTAVEHTGARAYDAVLEIFEKTKTPSIKVAAIRARTFDMILKNVRNQDLIYFFRGFATNAKAIYALREFFEANYDSINTRLETTFSMKYIIESVYSSFAKEEDRAKAEAFFKDKDIGKYNQALAQALDGINAQAALIKWTTGALEEIYIGHAATVAATGEKKMI